MSKIFSSILQLKFLRVWIEEPSVDFSDESEVQQLENSMSNHIGSSLENLTNHVRDGAAETNGELEIDLSVSETITNGDSELVHHNNRRKSTDSANNFKVQECNFNLQKLAIIEVRKPGKCELNLVLKLSAHFRYD